MVKCKTEDEKHISEKTELVSKTYFFKRTDQDTTWSKFVVTWYGAVKINYSFRNETAFLLVLQGLDYYLPGSVDARLNRQWTHMRC